MDYEARVDFLNAKNKGTIYSLFKHDWKSYGNCPIFMSSREGKPSDRREENAAVCLHLSDDSSFKKAVTVLPAEDIREEKDYF